MDRLAKLTQTLIFQHSQKNTSSISFHKDEQLLRHMNYSYFLARPHHRDQLFELIIQTSIRSLPPIKAFFKDIPNGLALAQKSETLYYQPKMEEMTTNNLSIVCFDRQNNNQLVAAVCGMCKTKDVNNYHLDKEGGYGRIQQHFFGSLEGQLSEQQRKLMQTDGMVYYIVILISKQSAQGRGLLSSALRLAEKQAKKHNFKYMYAVSVNYKLRGMLENSFEMKKVVQDNIGLFEFEVRRPFENIQKQDENMAIYWKEL